MSVAQQNVERISECLYPDVVVDCSNISGNSYFTESKNILKYGIN